MLSVPVNLNPIFSTQRRQRSNSLTLAYRDNFSVILPDQGGSFNATTSIFILWFHLTTTLTNHEIADMHNVTFRDVYGITAEEVHGILEELAHKWTTLVNEAHNAGRLPKPVARGWRVCDHGYDCTGQVDGPGQIIRGRPRGRRGGNVNVKKVESIWDGTWSQLMRCPRSHTTDTPHAVQLQQDLDSHSAQHADRGLNIFGITKHVVSRRPRFSVIIALGRDLLDKFLSLSILFRTWLLRNVLPCLQKICTILTWLLFLNFCLTPVSEFVPYSVLMQIRTWLQTWPGLILGIALVAAFNAMIEDLFALMDTASGQRVDRCESLFYRTAVGSAGAIWLLNRYVLINHLLEAYQQANELMSIDNLGGIVHSLQSKQLNGSNPAVAGMHAPLADVIVPMVSAAAGGKDPSIVDRSGEAVRSAYARYLGYL